MLKRTFVFCVSLAVCPVVAEAAEFHCGSGDVACLITAINQANSNSEVNTIHLEAGTYAVTAIDHSTTIDGATGLPAIEGSVSVVGAGAEATIIQRGQDTGGFRHSADTVATMSFLSVP